MFLVVLKACVPKLCVQLYSCCPVWQLVALCQHCNKAIIIIIIIILFLFFIIIISLLLLLLLLTIAKQYIGAYTEPAHKNLDIRIWREKK